MRKFTTSVIRLDAAGRWRRGLALGTTVAMLTVSGLAFTPAAAAAQAPVGLGTAASFAVLAGSTVTNTGSTTISGNLGVAPGSAIIGFPPGAVTSGSQYAADATALQAQSDLTIAYNDAAGRTPVTTVSSDLGGQTLAPGVYNSASSLALTGTVILDAYSDPNAVFIFQAASTLTTAPNSTIKLIDGAQACNVFWQVGSSATMNTSTTFVGNILALTSVTLDTGSTVLGRVLARNGAVTLDSNTITVPTCTTAAAPPPPRTAPGTTIVTAPSSSLITLGNSVQDVATVTGSANDGTPAGSVQFYGCGPGATSCSPSSATALVPAEPLIGGVATSPNFTPNAIGAYCFATVFSPSNRIYTGSSETGSSTNTECFTVTAPTAPAITTLPSSSAIILGNSVTDMANATGNATEGTPTGSVQFYTCGPGSALCASSLGTPLTPATPLIGGVANSPSFTPTAVGTYCFSAVYNPSGSLYAGTSETGSTINSECFTVTAAPTTPPKTTPPAKAPPAVVPSTHTGEPWAGLFYWLLVAMAGAIGIALVSHRVYLRYAHGRTGS